MNPQTRPVGYYAGEALGSCQRCNKTTFVDKLTLEWTNLRVCDRCWDPRPPQLTAPVVYAEGVPVPNASPRPPAVFIDLDNPVTPEDLE